MKGLCTRENSSPSCGIRTQKSDPFARPRQPICLSAAFVLRSQTLTSKLRRMEEFLGNRPGTSLTNSHSCPSQGFDLSFPVMLEQKSGFYARPPAFWSRSQEKIFSQLDFHQKIDESGVILHRIPTFSHRKSKFKKINLDFWFKIGGDWRKIPTSARQSEKMTKSSTETVHIPSWVASDAADILTSVRQPARKAKSWRGTASVSDLIAEAFHN